MRTEELKCEVSDCEATPKIDGNIQGVYCPRCKRWLVAATYLPPILTDTEEYRVILIGGDFKNIDHVKAISSVSNANFVQSRNLLREGGAEVLTSNAKNVEKAVSILARAGIDYRIEPDFPYTIDMS